MLTGAWKGGRLIFLFFHLSLALSIVPSEQMPTTDFATTSSEDDPSDGGSKSPSATGDSTGSIDSKEWEKNFLELREEFWALQEKTSEVDKYHQAEVESLQGKLEKANHQLERLEAENATLLV